MTCELKQSVTAAGVASEINYFIQLLYYKCKTVTYKRVYHWDTLVETHCTHSYSERRCHRARKGLLCENIVDLLTGKTMLFLFMHSSHHWIWNTRSLSSSPLVHHGRFSEWGQRVQNLFYAASRTAIMAKTLGVLCFRKDCRLFQYFLFAGKESSCWAVRPQWGHHYNQHLWEILT